MSQLKYLVIYLSLLVALVLMILPLPDWAQMFRPNWMALVLIYWTMALPKRVGLWFALFTASFVWKTIFWISGSCGRETGRLIKLLL